MKGMQTYNGIGSSSFDKHNHNVSAHAGIPSKHHDQSPKRLMKGTVINRAAPATPNIYASVDKDHCWFKKCKGTQRKCAPIIIMLKNGIMKRRERVSKSKGIAIVTMMRPFTQSRKPIVMKFGLPSDFSMIRATSVAPGAVTGTDRGTDDLVNI